jgi:hypothetical protein
MVNRNSHGHGTKKNRARRPKKNEAKRANKARARVRAAARQDALKEALAKGN